MAFPINKILEDVRYVTRGVLEAVAKFTGFDTDIYFPLSTNSVFQFETHEISYNLKPDISGTFMITGLFEAVKTGDRSLDQFFGTPPILYIPYNIDILNRSRVRVRFEDVFYWFVVSSIDVVNGTNGPLYHKANLSPQV